MSRSVNAITHRDDSLECLVCNNIAHFYCIGYTELNFNKMSKNSKARSTNKLDTCSNCLKPNQNLQRQKQNLLASPHKNSMEKTIEDLMASVSFLSSQFEIFSEKIDYVIFYEFTI